jgi:hypothetical protein
MFIKQMNSKLPVLQSFTCGLQILDMSTARRNVLGLQEPVGRQMRTFRQTCGAIYTSWWGVLAGGKLLYMIFKL